MSNDVPLSKQEVLVIASGGAPETAVAAIMLGFKKAASPTHYAHTQTTPCTTALRLAPHACTHMHTCNSATQVQHTCPHINVNIQNLNNNKLTVSWFRCTSYAQTMKNCGSTTSLLLKISPLTKPAGITVSHGRSLNQNG